MTRYVVATIKPWNVAAFHRRSRALPGSWTLIERPGDLTVERLAEINPRFAFFPHWSWKVPSEILGAVECVCFHMTDVPFGRGGSPLQNLIARGIATTKMSALRMVEELDAGPVYLKCPLDLSGTAGAIYARAADLVWDMIGEIVNNQPEPALQQGIPTLFPRRTPEQSRLPENGMLSALYDHIRMLDAPTYPRAFLKHGDFRLEFSEAELDGDGLVATVSITRIERSGSES
eukprot:TRINITY_DN80034_c0_g1_i1.p1 TRINITY_DN80034_c0_g1~~TRINITY_DN80034_c0_g1_i1.p1  ORF type:complete len:232 (-),score=21.41 TRINITY_DN80034_c0_g1_i1:160-855(-)